MEFLIDIFLWFLAVYMLLGVLFSIYFVAKGASLIDEGANDTPWHFKAIILPGTILLWILLLIKILNRGND